MGSSSVRFSLPMSRVSHILSVAACLSFAACSSPSGGSADSGKPKSKGVASTLAGEWSAPGPGDHFLLFKPDEMDPKMGRFGGWADFDRYEIKSTFAFGRTVTVQVHSSKAESGLPDTNIQTELSPDGQSLTVTFPGIIRGESLTRRSYKRVTELLEQ